MEKRLPTAKRPLRIAITGPESTGKSMLAQSLAQHYQSPWVPEYAREYLAQLGRPYREEDIVTIARGQFTREEAEASSATNFLFCDTELLVTYIWSMFKFGRCDSWIVEQMQQHPYDYYLLCDIDLPWEPDPLREHPGQREALFSLYRSELEKQMRPFGIVKGYGEERVRCAIRLLNGHFDNTFPLS